MNLFELFATLGLDTSGYDSGIDEAGKKANSFGSKIASGIGAAAKLGGAALTAASGAAVAFGKSAVSAGANFDTSMAQVAATMGKTMDELNSDINTVETSTGTFTGTLREFAQYLGSSTSFSASQSADALNYMALAGYDAQTSMEMLPTVLNLAAAGGIDLAYASDMVTDASSALGLSIDETRELIDKMATASSKSNTSVAQLGEAILTVGGTAKTLKGGTTELSTALGILADNGIKGAEGGTLLRNVILSLSAPAKEAGEAIDELGLEVFDAEGNMRPLNEVFGDLNDILSDMSQGEQTKTLSHIFNKTDLKGVTALLANANERFDELSGYIDNAADSAQAMADTQLDTLTGDITLFQSALEGAQIVLSDQLTPTLREFVQLGASGLSQITEGFNEGGLSGAMEAFGSVLSEGLGMIVENTPMIIEAGMKLLEALGQGLIDNLDILTNAALEIILKLIDGIGVALPQLISAGLTIIETLASGIADNIKSITQTIINVVVEIAKTLTNPETLTNILKAGLDIILGLAQGLLEALPSLIEALPVIIQNIVDFIISSIPLIIEAGIQLLISLVGALPDIITAIVEAIPQIISGIITAIINSIPQLIQAGIDLFISLIANLPTIIVEIVKAIPQIISGVITAIIGSIPQLITAGVELFVSLIENLPTIIIEIVKAVPQIITGLVSAFGDSIGSIIEVGGNLIKGLWEGISNAGAWLWDKIKGFFGGVVDKVKGFFGIASPSKLFRDEIGENLALGVGIGFTDEFSNVKKEMEKELDFASSGDFAATMSLSTRTDGTNASANGQNSYTSAAAEKQPLIVILQLPSGVEVGRQYIEDINLAKRVDGLAY